MNESNYLSKLCVPNSHQYIFGEIPSQATDSMKKEEVFNLPLHGLILEKLVVQKGVLVYKKTYNSICILETPQNIELFIIYLTIEIYKLLT